MGQKTSPIGFRLALTKRWKSLWYADKHTFGDQIFEDRLIRKFLLSKPVCVGTSQIFIKRTSGKVEATIYTARPGLVIGKKGAEVDTLKEELKKLIGKDVWIEVEEVKKTDLDAQLVADGVARQLERRMPFRRVIKNAIRSSMNAGAKGVKVMVSGRVGGAEIARVEGYQEGSVPRQTLRARIDFAYGRAETTFGSIGVKVWINIGEQEA